MIVKASLKRPYRPLVLLVTLALLTSLGLVFAVSSAQAQDVPSAGNGGTADGSANGGDVAIGDVLGTFEEDNRDYVDYKHWEFYKDSRYVGGYASAAKRAGAIAEFTFKGTSVEWATQKGPTEGITNVYLDGNLVKTFDGYRSTDLFDVSGFYKSGLSNTQHVLRLVVTGRKNASATNTYTTVDRFIVNGVLPSYPENSFWVDYANPVSSTDRGWWVGYKNSNASGGYYRITDSRSSPIYFGYYKGFTGPSVQLITQTGPNRGMTTIKIYEKGVSTPVKTLTPNLYSATTDWQHNVGITGLDPDKRYYMTVASADSTKNVVVDAFRAVPYQR